MEKSIEKYEKYKINTDGIVVNTHTNKKIKTSICNGYERLVLYNNGKPKSFALHRLLAEAFITNPYNKLYINHINGIKTDNRLENLEWCTQQENTKHAYKTGLNKGRKIYIKKDKLNDYDQLLSTVNVLIFKDEKYTIDKKGNVYNIITKKYIKACQTKYGYLKITLYVNGGQHTYLVHRLVGMVFIENITNKPIINHINGIKNDNRMENLEWCTYSDNSKHSHIIGTSNGYIGEKNGNSKLKEKDIIQIYYSEESSIELSKKYKISQTNISNIRNKKRWKSITDSMKNINRKTSYFTYEECRKWILENNKYGTYKKFKKYSKELPNYIPKNPNIFYKKEWCNWSTFLNYSKFLSYEEAKKYLINTNIKTEIQYQKTYKELGVRLPHHPERVYKKEWEGWKIFLNKN